LLDELIETWESNQRVNLLLLEGIPEDGMAATLSTRGGRDVSRQLAHLHTQRLRWLEAKGGADLAQGLPTFESQEHPSKEELVAALDASADAIGRFLREAGSGERKAKGLKKGLVVSVGYFIAHESHHRGSILLTLKQCGYRLEKRITYGIWDWHRI
jgi:uncharacterized damage-inducible protein DinB